MGKGSIIIFSFILVGCGADRTDGRSRIASGTSASSEKGVACVYSGNGQEMAIIPFTYTLNGKSVENFRLTNKPLIHCQGLAVNGADSDFKKYADYYKPKSYNAISGDSIFGLNARLKETIPAYPWQNTDSKHCGERLADTITAYNLFFKHKDCLEKISPTTSLPSSKSVTNSKYCNGSFCLGN